MLARGQGPGAAAIASYAQGGRLVSFRSGQSPMEQSTCRSTGGEIANHAERAWCAREQHDGSFPNLIPSRHLPKHFSRSISFQRYHSVIYKSATIRNARYRRATSAAGPGGGTRWSSKLDPCKQPHSQWFGVDDDADMTIYSGPAYKGDS